jgi:uncharacterized repeat protein (TIGR01451 family)
VGIIPTAQAKPPAGAGPASILLTVTEGLDPAAAGKNVLYTDTGTNIGKGTATQVTLTHAMPPGATAVSASIVEGSGTCAVTSSLVTCQLGNLKIGQSFKVDVLLQAPSTPGTMVFENGTVHLVRVTSNELGNDKVGSDPKTDTFFPAAHVSTEVKAVGPDFNADCLTVLSPLATGIEATPENPVVTILQLETTVGTATCLSLSEVLDSQNTGCGQGAICFMPQYVDALFPKPPKGTTLTITLIIDVSVDPLPTAFYADGVLVPDCPVTSGICNEKPFVTLSSGDLMVTFKVTTDIRLRG